MAKAKYWLMKSEPDEYSIDDLERDGETTWDGVRNYQARNYLRDELRIGDGVLFYHSSVSPPGVVGLARVSRQASPDTSAWDAKSPYYDPKSTPENPRWFTVHVAFVEKFPAAISLDALRSTPELKDLLVLRRGQRLSVQPVDPKHFRRVCRMGQLQPATTKAKRRPSRRTKVSDKSRVRRA